MFRDEPGVLLDRGTCCAKRAAEQQSHSGLLREVDAVESSGVSFDWTEVSLYRSAWTAFFHQRDLVYLCTCTPMMEGLGDGPACVAGLDQYTAALSLSQPDGSCHSRVL